MVSQVLEPLHMASSVPWFLVLEALGHIKQVDPALLIELVKKSPDISDDLGRNAREMVSLRILENLYNRGFCNKNNHMPPPGSQIGFDPSDRCEDVLHRILQGASAANLKLGGPEILKWDIHSFIMHKRSCLPTCSLKKLKDGILDGSNPLLALLKDRSGLAVTNDSQNGISIDGGDSNDLAHKPEGSSINTEIVEPNGKLDALITEKEDELLQELSPGRNLLPAKRDRSATNAENCEGQSHETQSTYEKASKKLKKNLVCTPKNGHEISGTVQQHGILADSSARVVEHIQEEGCEFKKDSQIQHMEESRSGEDHHCEDDTSTRLTLNIGVSPIEMMHCEQQVPQSDSKVPGETSGEGDIQNNNVDEAKGDNEGSLEPPTLNGTAPGVVQADDHVDEANNNHGGNFQKNAADSGKTKDDGKHHNHPEISSDSDEYNYERIDIATKKNAFLSSQCTYSQESLATQLNLCVKCNKNGHLLVCSSNTCPLVVHESCLGSTANFDGNGNFYCPFCAYSRAISEYLETKKKASLARKDLAAFIGLGVEQQLKKSGMRSHEPKQNQPRLNDELHENNEANNKEISLNEVNNPQRPPSISERQEVDPSTSRPCDNPPCGEKEADMTVEPRHPLMTVCQSARGQEKEQPPRHIVQKSDGDISHHRDPETSHGSERPDQISKQKVVSYQSDPPHEPTCGGTDAEESSEEENEKAVTSKYSIRFRKKDKQYTYPAIPLLRRKKLPWTRVEEETLKDGVQRFTSDHDRNIPWKKILEFGGDVFQKGRTTIDLKDKWRNICKGSPRSK